MDISDICLYNIIKPVKPDIWLDRCNKVDLKLLDLGSDRQEFVEDINRVANKTFHAGCMFDFGTVDESLTELDAVGF